MSVLLVIVGVLASFVLSIFLANLLIGIMSNTLSDVSDNARTEFASHLVRRRWVLDQAALELPAPLNLVHLGLLQIVRALRACGFRLFEVPQPTALDAKSAKNNNTTNTGGGGNKRSKAKRSGDRNKGDGGGDDDDGDDGGEAEADAAKTARAAAAAQAARRSLITVSAAAAAATVHDNDNGGDAVASALLGPGGGGALMVLSDATAHANAPAGSSEAEAEARRAVEVAEAELRRSKEAAAARKRRRRLLVCAYCHYPWTNGAFSITRPASDVELRFPTAVLYEMNQQEAGRRLCRYCLRAQRVLSERQYVSERLAMQMLVVLIYPFAVLAWALALLPGGKLLRALRRRKAKREDGAEESVRRCHAMMYFV